MSKHIISAKDYLSRAYRIDQRINSKLEQLISLRSLAEKAAPVLTGMPSGKGGSPHRMEETIAKMVDLEGLIDKELKWLVDTKHEIMTVIKCVEPVELQTILELRYLSFRTWEQIAVEMNFDRRHITRLHGKALQEVENIRRN